MKMTTTTTANSKNISYGFSLGTSYTSLLVDASLIVVVVVLFFLFYLLIVK